ncbi:ribonuclease P protein component [Silvibacterium sp.]|uniref:ribonuclease P protein component n=1 Tax=Silvibacterium sp. TaxID=1964179 RepID=UPI0039E6FDFE
MPDATPQLCDGRLHKHADYQHVYQQSRKHFSPSMTYFFRLRGDDVPAEGARVGLTAGRVLGKAIDRNRIKRRMREAVRAHLGQLPSRVDVVLHPRKSVKDMDFARLSGEVSTVFGTVRSLIEKRAAKTAVQPASGDRA